MTDKDSISLMLRIFLLFITIILLLFSPIVKGSVHELSKNIIISLIFFINTIWLLHIYITRKYITLNILKILPLLLFFLVVIIQIIPIPDILLKTVSIKSFELWNNSRILLNELGDYYTNTYFTVTIYPYATYSNLFLLLSYFLFGIYIGKHINTKKRLILLISPILLLTITEALIGFYQSFKIYGIYHGQGAHGTFVNKNHYAGFMELGIPLFLGLMFSFNKYFFLRNTSLFKIIIDPGRLFIQLIFLFIIPILFISIFLSKSRMGIISISLATGFFFVNTIYNGKKYRDTLWLFIIFLLLLVLSTTFVEIEPILKRFDNVQSDHRIYVWEDCINIIKDFPLFGSGLDTFKYVYPLYKFNVTRAVDYNFAHNDYIQLIIETGFIGFTCMISALIIFFKDSFRFLRINAEKNDSFKYFVTLGALTGVFSILIHSFADFNLHIPSNAVYFTTLIGIIYAINSNEYENNNPITARSIKKSRYREKSTHFDDLNDGNINIKSQ